MGSLSSALSPVRSPHILPPFFFISYVPSDFWNESWKKREKGQSFSRSIVLIVFGGVFGRRRRRQGCCHVIGIRGNGAGAGVAAYFGIGKQGFVPLLVHRGDGDEEAIARIEAKSRGRERRMFFAGRNRNALALEVLVHGAGRYNKVVDATVLDLIEFHLDTLQGVASGVKTPWR